MAHANNRKCQIYAKRQAIVFALLKQTAVLQVHVQLANIEKCVVHIQHWMNAKNIKVKKY